MVDRKVMVRVAGVVHGARGAAETRLRFGRCAHAGRHHVADARSQTRRQHNFVLVQDRRGAVR